MVDIEILTKAGINTEALMRRLMGNSSLIKIFVNKFIQDTTYTELCAALADGDIKTAEIKSHTLKGMCGNMSLDNLYALFTEQVNLLRRGDGAAAQNMLPEISAAYTAAIASMKDWLAKQ